MEKKPITLSVVFAFSVSGLAVALGQTYPALAQTQPPSSQQGGTQAPVPPALIDPPKIDPGIVQQPKTNPPPGSVVKPPVVDPEMAVDPESREAPAIKANPPTPEKLVPPPAPPEPIPIPPRTPSPSP